MDLKGLRTAQWKEKMVEYFNVYRWNTTWGDQDLINIFFHFFPGTVLLIASSVTYLA